MKQLIIIILSLSSILCYSQKSKLIGIYPTGELSDTLIITDSSLQFKYGNVYGFGSYKVRKDKIYVHAKYFTHKNSSYYEFESSLKTKDKFKITIFCPQNIIHSTNFLTVKEKNGRKEYLNWMINNSSPVLAENFNLKNPENKIVIIKNGSDKLIIPLSDVLGKSIKVNMTDNYTLMDETVWFRIIKNQYETILEGPYKILTREEKQLYGMNHHWPWKKRLKCDHTGIPNEYRRKN